MVYKKIYFSYIKYPKRGIKFLKKSCAKAIVPEKRYLKYTFQSINN